MYRGMVVPLTDSQQRALTLLIEQGSLNELATPEKVQALGFPTRGALTLSLWALHRRGLADHHAGIWRVTDTGREHAQGAAQSLLTVTVRCSRCGDTLLTAEPGSTHLLDHACEMAPIAGDARPALRAIRTQRPGSVPGQAVAAAAGRIAAGRASAQHIIILRRYANADGHGLTQAELEQYPDVDARAHRTRRLELSEAGLLKDSGWRRRAALPDGRRGRPGIVYIITQQGRDYAARVAT